MATDLTNYTNYIQKSGRELHESRESWACCLKEQKNNPRSIREIREISGNKPFGYQVLT